MSEIMLRRTAICLSVLLMSAPPAAHPQSDTSTPEQATLAWFGVLRNADWDGMATLMHPDALRQLRSFLEPLLDHPQGADFRRELFGNASSADLRQLSDTRLVARFLQFAMTQDPALIPALRTAHMTIVGRLTEGDTTHVVARFSMTIENITVTKMEISSLRPTPEGWRALLTADISALAQAIRSALEESGESDVK